MMASLVATCKVIAALASVILILGLMAHGLRLLARRSVPASGGAPWLTDELVHGRSDASLAQRRGTGEAEWRGTEREPDGAGPAERPGPIRILPFVRKPVRRSPSPPPQNEPPPGAA
jgi:hypothetical protein